MERDLHVEIAHTVEHGMELEFWDSFELWVWNEIGVCLCEKRGIECFLGYTACALLSCEVKWVLWMAWKEGMWVWLAGVFFLFCLLGFSLFFYLFYLIYGG